MNVLSAVDQVVVLKDHKLVPVEEVGGLEVYMQQLESEEQNDIDLSLSAQAPIAASEEQTTAGEVMPEVVAEQVLAVAEVPDVPASMAPTEPIIEKKDDGIEISLH